MAGKICVVEWPGPWGGWGQLVPMIWRQPHSNGCHMLEPLPSRDSDPIRPVGRSICPISQTLRPG